jgi:RNA polymerase sigma-70 factor, ECF subfamily
VLLDSADAFEDQAAHHRGELLIHCYRMLGTIDEAEDAVQETLARAWQGRQTFRRSVSLRAWLYRIATNVCLNTIEQRKRDRVEPGPCPDDLLIGIAAPEAGPEARYDAHESISLAFLTILQLLTPRQRAVLLLRDVMGFHAAEVAALLEMTVAAVTSALQRARATLRVSYMPSHAPVPSHLLERYVRAWEAADVTALVAMLREDAVLAMPPMPTVTGARQIGNFIAQAIFTMGPMRLQESRANGSPAFALYVKKPGADGFSAFALLVIASDGHQITRIDAFADPRVRARFDLRATFAAG